MTRCFLTGLLLVSCAWAGSRKPITEENYRIYRGDGTPATMDDLIAAARQANVTFLGESHDDPVAHFLEAEILKRVAAPDWALSMEMFERDVQGVVDEYLSGLIEQRDLIASGRAWNNYKTDYQPLLMIAKEQHMPVIAANAPKRYVDMVSGKGQQSLMALSPEAKRALPPLPYPAESAAYQERFKKLMSEEMGGAKGGGKADAKAQAQHESDNALQAQGLWDATMGDSIATFLKAHPDKHVLQVNGSFHSEYRQGILDYLERYRPGTSAVAVTMLQDKSFPSWKEADMKGTGDFVIVTDPRVKPVRPHKGSSAGEE